MRCICRYDKIRDISQVDQFGFVDLNKAISEGFVPADLQVNPDVFDGEEIDPESIIGKPSDRFEAMRIQESLADGVRRNNIQEKDVKSENQEKDVKSEN